MYTVSGKILIRETNEGVPDIIVRIFDFDAVVGDLQPNAKAPDLTIDQKLPYDSLGSVLTDSRGEFRIEFDEGDFTASGVELRPDIFIVLEMPEDVARKDETVPNRVIYTSKSMRLKAGKSEVFVIRLPEDLVKERGLVFHRSIIDQTALKSSIKNNKESYSELFKIGKGIADKAADVFKNFQYTSARADINFVADNHDTQEKIARQNAIIDTRIDLIERQGKEKRIRIPVSSKVREIIGENSSGQAMLNGETVEQIFPTTYLIKAEKRCFKQITPDSIREDEDQANEPGSESPGSPAQPTLPIPLTRELIADRLRIQMESATSPETALKYKNIVDQNDKLKKVCDSLNGLAICGGPADVTSYHDFKTIQIAFEHIWTAAFDSGVANLGKKLFEEIVKIEEGYVPFTLAPTTPAPAGYTLGVAISNTGVAQPNVAPRVAQPVPSQGITPGQPVAPIPSVQRPNQINTVRELRSFLDQFSAQSLNIPQHVKDLADQLDQKLSEAFSFQVFAPGTINYGLLYTFRQKWEPQSYQVGRLISSMPLAPKEVRKYSTKVVTTTTRNQKRLDDSEIKSHFDTSITSKAESEIINKAQNKTSFSLNAGASYSAGVVSADVKTQVGTEAENISNDTKKNFRESVVKAAHDFLQKNKTELEISGKFENEATTSGEISNPNDEIPVTYLFYELQRQYDISEELYRIDPVIFVANEVPMPDEIDFAWLTANSWILQKAILDPGYLAALHYLNENGLSGTLALDVLKDNLDRQADIVKTLVSTVSQKNAQVDAAFDTLLKIVKKDPSLRHLSGDEGKNAMSTLSSVLNPIGSMIGAMISEANHEEFLKRTKEATNMSLERLEKTKLELNDRLSQEFNALQSLTNQYLEELRRVLDREHAIVQLRIHIKENILYYMQAIWDHEPTDQRFFRLCNQEIDWFEPVDETPATPVTTPGQPVNIELILRFRFKRVKKKLIEVADLDEIMGYKGNYTIFAAKKRSHLHNYMMKKFIDENTSALVDPDDIHQYSTQELLHYLACIKTNNPDLYESESKKVIEVLNTKQQSSYKEKERIIIPTNSVYIEALPGKHPILEDHKLAHRALDVKKLQAEVRKLELENIRYASRAVQNKLDDPDFEKQTLITGIDEITTQPES